MKILFVSPSPWIRTDYFAEYAYKKGNKALILSYFSPKSLSRLQGVEMTKYVSVIIVNYNGAPFIRRLLQSLNEQTFQGFEVIFVDNGSTDDSIKVLQEVIGEKSFENICIKMILNKENLGFCKGNNVGLKSASGEYIVFLNNDTYVSSEWLEELVKVLDTYPSVGACQSKILFAGANKVQTVGNLADRFSLSGISADVHSQVKHMEKGVLVDTFFYPSGTSVMYRKTILEKIGGFDDEMFYGDFDMAWRTRLLGCKIATNLSSTCYHYGSQTTKKLFSRGYAFQDYRERIYVMTKNYSLSTFLKRILPSLALWFMESFYCSLKFGSSHIFMLVKAIFWNIRNARKLLNERRKVQRNRVVSDEEVERHMVSYPFFIYGVREKIKSIL
jgi:GT2 family glycosyltransferase